MSSSFPFITTMSLSVKPLPHCKSPHSRKGQSRAKTVCTWTKTATLYITIKQEGSRQCSNGQKQPHCKSPHNRQSQGWSKTMCTWTKTATLYITIQHAESKAGQRQCVQGQKQPHWTSPYGMQSRQAKNNVYMDKNSYTVHPRD